MKRGKGPKKSPWKPGASTTLAPTGPVAARTADEERAFKASIRERDRCHCQRCGRYSREVAHLYGEKSHPELRFDARNCLTLCPRCHRLDSDSAHKDVAAFLRWAADEFPRFAPLYAQFGKGEAYEEWAAGHDVRGEGA